LLLWVIEHCIKAFIIGKEIDKTLSTLCELGVKATIVPSFIRVIENIV